MIDYSIIDVILTVKEMRDALKECKSESANIVIRGQETTSQRFLRYLYFRVQNHETIKSQLKKLTMYDIVIMSLLGHNKKITLYEIDCLDAVFRGIHNILMELIPRESVEWRKLIQLIPELKDYAPIISKINH